MNKTKNRPSEQAARNPLIAGIDPPREGPPAARFGKIAGPTALPRHARPESGYSFEATGPRVPRVIKCILKPNGDVSPWQGLVPSLISINGKGRIA